MAIAERAAGAKIASRAKMPCSPVVSRSCDQSIVAPLNPRVRWRILPPREGTADPSQSGRMSRALTPAQRAVLELVGSGLTTKGIAARLAMSPATVETHVRAAMERLEARTRLQAASVAQLGVGSLAREGEPMVLLLKSDEHRLLRLIAAGASMSEVAASMHVSRRTCARRLAAAKTKLGVQTTVEAALRTARDHAYSLLAGVWVGLQAAADALDIVEGPVAFVYMMPF
jgi:DNA-binding NarL/FixJ family response regulator